MIFSHFEAAIFYVQQEAGIPYINGNSSTILKKVLEGEQTKGADRCRH